MKEKKSRALTITLTESDYNKAKEQAEQERRPLAQLLGLVVSDYLNERGAK